MEKLIALLHSLQATNIYGRPFAFHKFKQNIYTFLLISHFDIIF